MREVEALPHWASMQDKEVREMRRVPVVAVEKEFGATSWEISKRNDVAGRGLEGSVLEREIFRFSRDERGTEVMNEYEPVEPLPRWRGWIATTTANITPRCMLGREAHS